MKVRIASVHFFPLSADRTTYGGVYRLPAVPVGGDPVIYEIEDKVEICQEPLEGQNKRVERRFLIDGLTIARDIVGQWTGKGGHSRMGTGPDSYPGVWIVRDHLPRIKADGTIETDLSQKAVMEPASSELQRQMFEEDLAAARAADANYAMYLVNDASALALDPRQIKFIQEVAKAAARAYQPNVTWLREGAQLQMKTCMYCQKPINTTVIKCPHCAEVVNREAWAALQVQQETALRSERSKRSAEEKAAEKAASERGKVLVA